MTHSIKKGQTHALSLSCIFIPSLLPSIIFVSPCGSLGHSLQHASAWFLSHVVLLRRALQYDLHHSESFRHLFIKYSVLLCFPVILVSRRHLLPEALRHSRQHAFHHTRLYSVTNSNMQLAMLHSLRSLHVAEFHAGRNSNHVRFYCQYLFVTVSFFVIYSVNHAVVHFHHVFRHTPCHSFVHSSMHYISYHFVCHFLRFRLSFTITVLSCHSVRNDVVIVIVILFGHSLRHELCTAPLRFPSCNAPSRIPS